MQKIMVVDHEPRTCNLMRSLATPLGYAVLSFENYETAGKEGENQRFESIFVGIQSPEQDALDLIHRIRNSEPNRSTLVVTLSATDDIASLRKAYGQGADLFLIKPLTGERLQRMLVAFPDWKDKRHAARLPLITDVTCIWNARKYSLRSMNISETGMLLQPSPEVEIGQEVKLEFKIPEIRAALAVTARVVRTEGAERAGVQFVGLAPEDINAIQVYVMGRMKDQTRSAREFLNETGPRRLFDPYNNG